MAGQSAFSWRLCPTDLLQYLRALTFETARGRQREANETIKPKSMVWGWRKEKNGAGRQNLSFFPLRISNGKAVY